MIDSNQQINDNASEQTTNSNQPEKREDKRPLIVKIACSFIAIWIALNFSEWFLS